MKKVVWTRPRVLMTVLCALLWHTACQSDAPSPKKSAEPTTRNATRSLQVFAFVHGDSSLVYVQGPGDKSPHRLTTRTSAWETHPVLSPDGVAVAYALAAGPEAKSEVWLSRVDGSHAHRVSGPDEDAMMPAFGADSRKLFYVRSGFFGHHSPIARPGKHDFDVEALVVDPEGPVEGASPTELTHQRYHDLLSLSVSPDGKHFLVSVSEYPIGSMIEEFEVENPLRIWKMFQPHVPSEPRIGPSFGQASYVHDAMDIVFTAASQGQGDKYDYNVFQMSDVTGSELVQLTNRSGMIDEMSANKDGSVIFSADGKRYGLDPQTKAVEALDRP